MTGFERYTKKTKRTLFQEEMERVVPWGELCALIEPHYPKAGNGRAPIGVERRLRIYFLQQWFNLSDPSGGIEGSQIPSIARRQQICTAGIRTTQPTGEATCCTRVSVPQGGC